MQGDKESQLHLGDYFYYGSFVDDANGQRRKNVPLLIAVKAKAKAKAVGEVQEVHGSPDPDFDSESDSVAAVVRRQHDDAGGRVKYGSGVNYTRALYFYSQAGGSESGSEREVEGQRQDRDGSQTHAMSQALYNLAMMHRGGVGVGRDLGAAKRHLKRAMEIAAAGGGSGSTVDVVPAALAYGWLTFEGLMLSQLSNLRGWR
jgi:TPR repeat protein